MIVQALNAQMTGMINNHDEVLGLKEFCRDTLQKSLIVLSGENIVNDKTTSRVIDKIKDVLQVIADMPRHKIGILKQFVSAVCKFINSSYLPLRKEMSIRIFLFTEKLLKVNKEMENGSN